MFEKPFQANINNNIEKEKNKNKANDKDDNMITKVKNYILFLFESFFYYLPQYRTIENTFNSYPIINIASLTLSIILIILFIKLIYNSITKDDQNPNSNISRTKILNPENIISSNNDKKKNSISLKGRVKKIPDIANYNEMFASAILGNSQNLDEKKQFSSKSK